MAAELEYPGGAKHPPCQSADQSRESAGAQELLSYMEDLVLELKQMSDKSGHLRLAVLLEAAHREIEVLRRADLPACGGPEQ